MKLNCMMPFPSFQHYGICRCPMLTAVLTDCSHMPIGYSGAFRVHICWSLPSPKRIWSCLAVYRNRDWRWNRREYRSEVLIIELMPLAESITSWGKVVIWGLKHCILGFKVWYHLIYLSIYILCCMRNLSYAFTTAPAHRYDWLIRGGSGT